VTGSLLIGGRHLFRGIITPISVTDHH